MLCGFHRERRKQDAEALKFKTTTKTSRPTLDPNFQINPPGLEPSKGMGDRNGVTVSMESKLSKAQIKRRRKKAMMIGQDEAVVTSEGAVSTKCKGPPASKVAVARQGEVKGEDEQMVATAVAAVMPSFINKLAHDFFECSKSMLGGDSNSPEVIAGVDQLLYNAARTVFEDQSVEDVELSKEAVEFARLLSNSRPDGSTRDLPGEVLRVAKALTDGSYTRPESVTDLPDPPSKSEASVSKSVSDALKSASDASVSGASKSTSDAPKSASVVSKLEASKPKSGSSVQGSHGSESSSCLAKGSQLGVGSVGTSSGTMACVQAVPKSSATLLSACASDQKVIVTRGEMPIEIGNEANELCEKSGKDRPLQIISSDPKSSRSTLSDEQIDSLISNIGSLSCRFGSSKEEEEDQNGNESQEPKFNKVISVLSDPFCISRNPLRPQKGATVYFMREDAERTERTPQNTSDNVKPKMKSIAEDITDRLTELMSSAMLDEPDDSRKFDCNFRAMEFHHLPKFLRETIALEKTGRQLETMKISLQDYRDLIGNTKIYGKKMTYEIDDPVNSLTAMCIPLELNLGGEVVDSLSQDLFRVADFERPVPVITVSE